MRAGKMTVGGELDSARIVSVSITWLNVNILTWYNLVLCGRWESYPREFAKCRRCRKAKYCGKECQSKAWSDGHRFWCSAKEGAGAPGASGTTGERAEGD